MKVWAAVLVVAVSLLGFASAGCPSATYRDAAAVDKVPTSPAIPSTTLQVTYPHSSPVTDFRYLMAWGNIGVCNTSANGDVGLYLTQWIDPVVWFLGRIKMTVRANSTTPQYKYRVSFSMKQDPTNNYANANISRISALFLNNFNHDANWGIAADAQNNPAIALGPLSDVSPSTVSPKVPTIYSNGTAWQYYEAYVTSPVFSSTAQVALRIQLNVQPSSTVNFFFRNFKIDVLPVTWKAPTLLTVDSESVVLRKVPTAFDANPRNTSCPHLQSGLKYWHDPATWGGAVPSSAGAITLPENTKVLVSSCSFDQGVVYPSISVPASSELIFDDANITLWVKDIVVSGKLRIGAPQCRLFSTISITYFGAKDTTDRMGQNLGQKGIGVAPGGSLDIHGKQYHPTWARLAATAYAGDDRVYLLGVKPNWEVGQQVVVITSSYKDEITKENEIMTIAAISNSVVVFTTPLKFSHWASQEYQVEVGLLSRRITLQGDQASSDPESFGGHTIIRGEGRVSGTRFLRMGQQNVMARYPLHWHMLLGGCTSCYSRDNAFTQTYYRCISIHATHNAEISRNVAYDVYGHCFYLEDGIEENNTISYNLAAYIHPIMRAAAGPSQTGEIFTESAQILIPADTTAGGFYFTNAYNRAFGNAASGGWAGYSFPNLFRPIGPSATLPVNNYNTTFNPASRPNLEFDGNTVHSAGYFWSDTGCIYCGGNLYMDANGKHVYNSGRVSRTTTFPNGTGTWMRFTNTKAFLCRAGVAHWGDKIEVDGFEGHDVGRSALLFGDTWLNNAIVTGRTLNPTDFINQQGFQFYDTYVKSLVTNVQFRRYFDSGNTNPQYDNRVIISMTHSDQYKPQSISAVRNITFRDVPRRQIIGNYLQNTGATRYYNFYDNDGSLTLRGYPVVAGSNNSWWNLGPDCGLELDWALWVCRRSSDREVVNLEVEAPGLIDGSKPYNFGTPAQGDTTYYVGNTTLFGNGIPDGDNRGTIVTRNVGITGVANRGWYLWFDNGAPSDLIITPRQVNYGNYVLLAVSYPAGTTFTVKSEYIYWSGDAANFVVQPAASLAEVQAANGGKYYFSGTHLYVMVVDRKATPTQYFERGGARLYNVQYGYRITVKATGFAVARTTGTTTWGDVTYNRPSLAFNNDITTF